MVSKLLTQKGTLRVGDVIVCGAAFGRIKAMYDTLDRNKRHKQVGPSTPVNVTGLDIAPGAGDRFYVLDDISQARHLAEQRVGTQGVEDHLATADGLGNLNPTGLKLLQRLMEASPWVVAREELELRIWGEELPDSDSLRVHIHGLRNAIDKPFDVPLIHTRHGIGYRMVDPNSNEA